MDRIIPNTPSAKAKAWKRKRYRRRRQEIPLDWEERLRTLFPKHFTAPFADFHKEFWEWVTSLEPGVRPRPLVKCIFRKGGKSTNVECAAVEVGTPTPELIENEDGEEEIVHRPPQRNYILYVSGTQQQADDHVKTIASHLEESDIGLYYPDVAKARVDEYGDRWGWNRQRLVTASGLIIDAYGLFGSGRGAKLEEYRPDMVILDDIDEEDDSQEVVDKKRRRIQQQVIPSGSQDRAIVFIQNLVHENSVMSRLLDGEDDWLMKRKEIGPIPAAEDLQYEKYYSEKHERMIYEVTGGTPSWEGFDLQDIEDEINDVGPTSFEVEYQHEVEKLGGGIFDHLEYRRKKLAEVITNVDFVRTTVSVDPAVTSNKESDCHAIQVDALGEDDHIYRLFSWEQQATPEACLRKALLKAVEYGAHKVVIETDQGGETWGSVFKRAWKQLKERDEYPHINEETPRPRWEYKNASSTQKSKTARGMEMLQDYEAGQIVHVTGTHLALERALNRAFVTKPFDLADASYWSWQELREAGSGGNSYDIN